MPLTEDQVNKWDLENELVNKDNAPEFFKDGELINECRFENEEKEKEDLMARTQAGADFAFALIQIGKKDLTEEEKERIPY